MFNNLFKRTIKENEVENEIISSCACENNNEHCDLILQLRKCQDLRKVIKNEIEVLEDNSDGLIFNFIGLLKNLEANGLRMDAHNKWLDTDIYCCNKIVELTIDRYSSADIFRITEELKTYKNKADIICEKRRALKVVEDDIRKIKSKLDIE